MKKVVLSLCSFGIAISLTAGYLPLSLRYGDVNQDSSITEADAALVEKHINGSEPLTDQEKFNAADINADGTVDSLDLDLFNRYLLGEIHIGGGTFYGTDGSGGNCDLEAIPDNYFVAAMNTTDYDGSNICGAYVEVTGPKGSVTLRITDRLPEGNPGDIDLAEKIYHYIADPTDGRVPITWKIVAGDVSGPVAYHFKVGSNIYWTAVQLRNHRYPIKKFEYLKNGEYVTVPREYFNYFVETSGMGEGPYTFRVTDIYDQVIIDTGIVHAADEDVQGEHQFPVYEQGTENELPVVSITSPLSGTEFKAGETVDVLADTSDPDGSIDRVVFYVDDTMHSSDTVSPYGCTLNGLAVGAHSIYAIAYDNTSAMKKSVPVAITIKEEGTTPPVDQNISVYYMTSESGDTTNTIRPHFEVHNTGDEAVDLADVTLRYWFTKDGTDGLQYACDWAVAGTDYINAAFVNTVQTAASDAYFEVSFAPEAGALQPGESSGLIMLRFWAANWLSFNQVNDYSFDGSATAFTMVDTVTGYINGALLSGIEP